MHRQVDPFFDAIPEPVSRPTNNDPVTIGFVVQCAALLLFVGVVIVGHGFYTKNYVYTDKTKARLQQRMNEHHRQQPPQAGVARLP